MLNRFAIQMKRSPEKVLAKDVLMDNYKIQRIQNNVLMLFVVSLNSSKLMVRISNVNNVKNLKFQMSLRTSKHADFQHVFQIRKLSSLQTKTINAKSAQIPFLLMKMIQQDA